MRKLAADFEEASNRVGKLLSRPAFKKIRINGFWERGTGSEPRVTRQPESTRPLPTHCGPELRKTQKK